MPGNHATVGVGGAGELPILHLQLRMCIVRLTPRQIGLSRRDIIIASTIQLIQDKLIQNSGKQWTDLVATRPDQRRLFQVHSVGSIHADSETATRLNLAQRRYHDNNNTRDRSPAKQWC